MVTARWYPHGAKNFQEGDIDFVVDTIRAALLDNTYVYSDTHEFFSDVAAAEVSGTGYTADGETVASPSVTLRDSSALTAWAASTAYVVGDVVRASVDNGHVFRCVVAGTSGGTEPSWNTTSFRETADGSVVWVEFGSAVIVLDGLDVSWPNSSVTARYVPIYKDTGVASTSPLIGVLDLEQDESSSAGDFTVQWATGGILRVGVGSIT